MGFKRVIGWHVSEMSNEGVPILYSIRKETHLESPCPVTIIMERVERTASMGELQVFLLGKMAYSCFQFCVLAVKNPSLALHIIWHDLSPSMYL